MLSLSKPIFLIGLPASGKTTAGKALSAFFNVPHLDTDHMICTRYGKTIPELFQQEGERYFRWIEKETLHTIPASPSQIISTGGGLPCHHDNMDWMLGLGLVIYLKSDVHTLSLRIKGQGGRPMFEGLDLTAIIERMSQLLAMRQSCYEQAHLYWDATQDEDAFAHLADRISTHIGSYI